jgi:rhamnose transport system ATP-binding protein
MALLEARDITKSYAGVQALKSASFELRAGEVHALVGENGAGKSTLIKIITGAVQNDGGTITLDGQTINDNSPQRAKSQGIAAIYQQPALFPELTVAENIAIGLEQQGVWQRINWKARHTRAAELLAQVGAKISTDALAGELTMPQQQLVEIARALVSWARVIVFDEPTSSLSQSDTRRLFEVIGRLKKTGYAIVYE